MVILSVQKELKPTVCPLSPSSICLQALPKTAESAKKLAPFIDIIFAVDFWLTALRTPKRG
jgi:hypothetical protein